MQHGEIGSSVQRRDAATIHRSEGPFERATIGDELGNDVPNGQHGCVFSES